MSTAIKKARRRLEKRERELRAKYEGKKIRRGEDQEKVTGETLRE